MTQFLVTFSMWLHSLAMIIFVGYFLLLALIYLPAFQNDPDAICGPVLGRVSKHSRIWLYISMLVFFITGIYLMFIDPNYHGIGNFSNPWAILMLTKHILIFGMIGIGFWFNAILRVGPLMSSNTGTIQAIARFRQYVNMMAIIGVVVLLLTAFSQIQ